MMKKLLCIALAAVFVLVLGSCATNTPEVSTTSETSKAPEASTASETPDTSATSETAEPQDDIHAKSEGTLTYAEYIATPDNTEVTIETFVQDKQSWWDNKATLYTQDKDGAYFLYNAAISEEDYNKLVPGQKIRVKGTKTSWSGEIEMGAGATVEILSGNYIAPAFDATSLLGNNDELAKHMNEFVTFKGVKIEAKGEEGLPYFRNWDNSGVGQADADLYFDISFNGGKYTFVVEYYLRNENTDAYKAVENLKVGDTVDLEGFMYWYEGPQAHITSVTVK